MATPMLKIRRPLGRLIFNMGIATPGKNVFLIETAPWLIIDTQIDMIIDNERPLQWNYVEPYLDNCLSYIMSKLHAV